jgi:uncharacterized membrane protein (DUF373 family)
MDGDEEPDRELTRLGAFADRSFLRIEIIAYMLLGVLLTVAVVLGIIGAAGKLYAVMQLRGDADALVVAIDRLLFVLMVVEVLHTVRVSFRAGTLVSEPFLVVGLIASIRRVLVITLESSRANQPGHWTAESAAVLHATMLELGVLGGLILIMVMSIYLLRRSTHRHTSSEPVRAPA